MRKVPLEAGKENVLWMVSAGRGAGGNCWEVSGVES